MLGIPQGTQFFLSEDRTTSQQNAHRKAFEEKLKTRIKDVLKEENIGK